MPATFKINDEVRAVLEKATIDSRSVVLNGQLDRGLYVQVNKVLEGAGGKWNRGLRAHVFERDPREALGLAIETGVAKNVKQELQAFYTPDDVADRLVESVDLPEGAALVLEPSVGGGALVRAVWRKNEHADVIGFDIDRVAVERLQKDKDSRLHVFERDFLEVDSQNFRVVDRVVMNPPFTKGQDIDHVLHALEFLKPGGVLASIMSGSALSGRTKRHHRLREALEAAEAWNQEELPGGSFKESGTGVRALILAIWKKG
jgi:predicted RNA methylase